MRFASTTSRVALGLTSLGICVCLGAYALGTFAHPAGRSGLPHPLLILAAFASATYLLFFVYLRRLLPHLGSQVLPNDAQSTLDSLAVGVLVMDKSERILMANESLARNTRMPCSELLGCRAADLPWEADSKRKKGEAFPWQQVLRTNAAQLGDLLTLRDKDGQRQVLKVSAKPVNNADGTLRGCVASFDDVTEIVRNREELRKMLDTLSESRDEIHRQNLELERLATRDSLTHCLNRRAFFTELENNWSASTRHHYPLSCIMIDLDHFKSINDTRGHQTGDMVLEKTAELLRSMRRRSDLVCRYGGEEFCILLPLTDLNDAYWVGERYREAIAATDFNGLQVTASIGVTARASGAGSPQELIDQADKCLYVAKRGGRNTVVRYDQAQAEISEFEALGDGPVGDLHDDDQYVETNEERHDDSSIPFHAVTALVSALAHRDPATADHSRRVADLCVATARRLMPTSESYLLEIGALLHDIGKIGVPDSILLKPGRLTDEEWELINTHERIGAEIVQSTFSNALLAETVRTYRAWFGDGGRQPELPTGDAIPLAARILAIADAYDSMTHQTVYRKPLTREEAFSELRRCAGSQFDPELVERFIDTVSGQDDGNSKTNIATSKASALSFGIQIERLADALEHHDTARIAVLAKRLQLTAGKFGAAEIASVAGDLNEAASKDSHVDHLVKLTNELLDLCRLAQRAYLDTEIAPAELPPEPRAQKPKSFEDTTSA